MNNLPKTSFWRIVLSSTTILCIGLCFSPPSFSFDYDGCVNSVVRLKKSAKNASDLAEYQDGSLPQEIGSALSDVESKLARAKRDCGAPDYCQAIKNYAKQFGRDAMHAICLSTEVGDRQVLCKACADSP